MLLWTGRVSAVVPPGLLVLFFFFQAEDGIRDLTVTGVQTCALPISSRPSRRRRPTARRAASHTDPTGRLWRSWALLYSDCHLDPFQGIVVAVLLSLQDGVHGLHAADDFAEHRILPVQAAAVVGANEKLGARAVGIVAARHRQRATAMGPAVEFGGGRVAGGAAPVRGPVHGLAVWIASPDDLETGRIDPMERRAVIKPDRRQLEEILAMARGHVEVEFYLELPVLGGNDRTRIFLRHAHGNLTPALMPGSGVARSGDALVRRDPVRAVILRLEDAPARAGVHRPVLAHRERLDRPFGQAVVDLNPGLALIAAPIHADAGPHEPGRPADRNPPDGGVRQLPADDAPGLPSVRAHVDAVVGRPGIEGARLVHDQRAHEIRRQLIARMR